MISRVLLWGSWLVLPLFHVSYAIHQESFHLQNITGAQITRITQPSHVMEMIVTSNLLVLTLEHCNLFLSQSGNLLKNWHQFLTPLFFKNPIISHFTQNENSTVLSGLRVPTWPSFPDWGNIDFPSVQTQLPSPATNAISSVEAQLSVSGQLHYQKSLRLCLDVFFSNSRSLSRTALEYLCCLLVLFLRALVSIFTTTKATPEGKHSGQFCIHQILSKSPGNRHHHLVSFSWSKKEVGVSQRG